MQDQVDALDGARRARRVPQLHAGPRRAPPGRARLPRRRAGPALPGPGAAARRVDAAACSTAALSRCSPSTRRTACRSGDTTSGPTTSRCPLLHERWPDRAPDRADRHGHRDHPRARSRQRLNLDGAASLRGELRPAQHPVPHRGARTSRKRQLLDLLRSEHPGDAGIVYCLSRASVEKTARVPGAERHRGVAVPRRARRERPRHEPGPLPARGRPGHGRDHRVRHGHRQARRPLRRPPGPAQVRRGLLPGDRPRRPGRAALHRVAGLRPAGRRAAAQDDRHLARATHAHRRRLAAHLDAMLALCETVECRRVQLLAYFGQTGDAAAATATPA